MEGGWKEDGQRMKEGWKENRDGLMEYGRTMDIGDGY